uniref:Uncharacterized protein n=1 Tax=Rhipicephalus zambeziensis TaxID=60191 RepID=A0A224YCQ4_9ACAR
MPPPPARTAVGSRCRLAGRSRAFFERDELRRAHIFTPSEARRLIGPASTVRLCRPCAYRIAPRDRNWRARVVCAPSSSCLPCK